VLFEKGHDVVWVDRANINDIETLGKLMVCSAKSKVFLPWNRDSGRMGLFERPVLFFAS
jgi:hypothetical protein